jgi:hypothetical protein
MPVELGPGFVAPTVDELLNPKPGQRLVERRSLEGDEGAHVEYRTTSDVGYRGARPSLRERLAALEALCARIDRLGDSLED